MYSKFFVDADCNHSERRMSSFVCSPDGMYVVDASKDVLDGGAGCWTSWVLTRGLADYVGPQITVIRVSNHSIISSCCYATQLHLFFGGSGVCDKGAEDGALGGVDGTEDNSDRVNCGKDIGGVGVG